MAMDPNAKVVLGSIAFAIFWALAVFPAVSFMPIGRTAGSLLGALLMVLFQVLTPDEAYDAIDLPILGLLFGTMVVGAYLEQADMFRYLGKLLSWKSQGAKDLLWRICLISAVSSALFTNDTACLVLTEFVLKIAQQHNLPPLPFLLALASSANIGSSATQIGNPQNLVIAVRSKITFGRFLFGILPAMLVGVCVNALILLCMYRNLLSVQKDKEDAMAKLLGENDVVSPRFSPAAISHLPSSSSQELHSTVESMNTSATNHVELSVRTSSAIQGVEHDNFTGFEEDTLGFSKKWKRASRKACVYLITLGMLLSFLVGLNMSWTTITAALALVVLDFRDATPCLEKVSYTLLIFFCGMFITIEGFNKIGIPSALWEFVEPYAKIHHISGRAVLAVVIIVLSNLASNVPTVLILGDLVAASAAAVSSTSEEKSWLILAWVSTVAGNLSLLGSAANLIVCEQARRAQRYGYNLSFWSHLKFGVPSTIIVTAIGMALIGG